MESYSSGLLLLLFYLNLITAHRLHNTHTHLTHRITHTHTHCLYVLLVGVVLLLLFLHSGMNRIIYHIFNTLSSWSSIPNVIFTAVIRRVRVFEIVR